MADVVEPTSLPQSASQAIVPVPNTRFRPWLRFFVFLVPCLFLIFLLAVGFNRDPNAVASPLIDHAAPTFTLRTLDHKDLSLAHFRGRPVVVNFWASWCLSCKIEHPYLVDAWRFYKLLGVAFIGIVYQDAAENARAFMKQHGGGWPSVLDPNATTSLNYGVTAVPETYFIDRQGIVRYKSTGPVTPSLLTHDIGGLLATRRRP